MNNEDEPPSADQLDQYSRLKDDMLQATRKHGSMHFVGREANNHVGLINQGATCYLNSLLQSLFMTREFRAAVYGWTYDPAVHGSGTGGKEQCIPYQLQALFARLQLSSESAVGTKALTKAFGWGGAEAFTQHDVQELTLTLFDALEKSDYGLRRFAAINALWKGKQSSFIQPLTMTSPEQRHVRFEQFLDIQVPVAGMATLEAALKQVTATEELTGENQWFCDELNQKVNAVRGTCFEELPKYLTLHLLRFLFDTQLLRRVKVLDALSFPPSIDLGFLLNQESESSKSSAVYDLVSILMHSGSADRGHYYAYIKDTAADAGAAEDDDDGEAGVVAARVGETVGEASEGSSSSVVLLQRRVRASVGQERGASHLHRLCRRGSRGTKRGRAEGNG